MNVIGYVLMVFALGWFLYKLYIAWSGGYDVGLPINDGFMFPPALGVVGLYLALLPYDLEWSYWIYIALWVGLTILAAGAIFVGTQREHDASNFD